MSLASSETEESVDDSTTVSQKCCRPGYRVRRVRSRGAVLVLLWNFLVDPAYLSYTILLERLVPVPAAIPDLVQVVLVFYYPFAGWLADVYFGRYKVMHAHLLLMWVGSVAIVLTLIVEYLYPQTTTVLNYCVLLPAIIVLFIGRGGFLVTSLPFGTDQMPDASGEETSAFIHWFIWAVFAGRSTPLVCTIIFNCSNSDTEALVHSLIMSVFVSFALCTNYLFRSWLTIEPQSQNPMKTIVSVLKYAATHKYPTRRSAFTYWEEEIPSRVDLGKSKYGGPFTNEQVEDVKTFFRILVYAASITAFVIPGSAVFQGAQQPYHYKHSSAHSNCYCSSQIYYRVFTVAIIPFYEVFIYPLARNWIPTTVKRAALGAFLTIGVSLFLLLIEGVGHSTSSTPVPCMFLANESSATLAINYYWVNIPLSVLFAVQVMIFEIAVFEFICAQSPYNMKGLLIGLGLSVTLAAGTIGEAVSFAWSQSWKMEYSTPSCGFWYYLFTALIGIIGLVALVIVAKWYRRRERDEVVNVREFAENYYSLHSDH